MQIGALSEKAFETSKGGLGSHDLNIYIYILGGLGSFGSQACSGVSGGVPDQEGQKNLMRSGA